MRDDKLLNIVISATTTNISTLSDLRQFENVNIITDFAIQVLRDYAWEHQARRDELKEMNKRYDNEIDFQKQQI